MGTILRATLFLLVSAPIGCSRYESPLAEGGGVKPGPKSESEDRSRVLLVGTDDGLYRLEGSLGQPSTSWSRKVVLDSPRRSIRFLARDPETGDFWAGYGLRGAGLLYSKDGFTWVAAPGWPTDREAWSVAFPGGGRVLVGSQPPDMWQGRVNEAEWTQVESVRDMATRRDWTFVAPPHQAHILGFSRDPGDPQAWLAVVEQGGVLRSQDGGRTWVQSSPIWDAHVVVHTGPHEVIVAEGSGLQRSNDGGRTWNKVESPSSYATGLTQDTEGTLYAACREAGHAIWLSRDGGRVWSKHPAGAVDEPGHGVHALVADPFQAGVIFHGTGTGILLVERNSVSRIAADLPVVRRILVVSPSRRSRN